MKDDDFVKCPLCNGKGYLPEEERCRCCTSQFLNPFCFCDLCYGSGKVDWITNITRVATIETFFVSYKPEDFTKPCPEKKGKYYKV